LRSVNGDEPGLLRDPTATAQLYHHVTIKETTDAHYLTSLLSPDNLGLRHIRHVRLLLETKLRTLETNDDGRPVDAGFDMIVLPTSAGCTADLFLWSIWPGWTTRQKRLRNLRVDQHTDLGESYRLFAATDERSRREIARPLAQCVNCPQIATLQLCLDFPPAVGEARKLLFSSKNIKRLNIDARPSFALSMTKKGIVSGDE